jgi:hypothetical protein
MTRTNKTTSGGAGRYVPLEQAPELNGLERRRLQTVWKRIEFLEQRIAWCKENNPSSMGNYIAEVKALEWVLTEAKLPIPSSKDLKEN